MRHTINDLLDEHSSIIDFFKSIDCDDFYGADMDPKMSSLKGLLLFHMDKERDLFFKKVKHATKFDTFNVRMLQVFSDEYNMLRDNVVYFFDTYHEIKNQNELKNNLKNLLELLTLRMKSEELILFPHVLENHH
ncbi:MAG: hypothetical protein ISR65_09460 [Bacteriovoracaceae bacterium]|nr:hypothetical protein [Bacteriovoracaceae bacterium]